MQIWQSSRKKFQQRPTFLRSLSAFDYKVNLVQKKIYSNFHYGQVARSFDNPAEEKLPEGRAKFDQCPKIMNKITIFRKTSRWKFFWRRKWQFCWLHWKNCHTKPRSFCSTSEHVKSFIKKLIFVTKLFHRTLRIEISQTRRKSFDRKCSAQ